ncbi:MAG: hypothetical protein J5848_04875, partial [Bacteroidales bacterium]|nr:hypothetical protein [Bacteroidales bacterium]
MFLSTICTPYSASDVEPKMIYGVAIPIWDSLQNWNDTAAWIFIRDSLFCGFIAVGGFVRDDPLEMTDMAASVSILDTVHMRIGLNVWSDNMFKFVPNSGYDCPDSVLRIIEVYFDTPVLVTDSFWVGSKVLFHNRYSDLPNLTFPVYGRAAIPDHYFDTLFYHNFNETSGTLIGYYYNNLFIQFGSHYNRRGDDGVRWGWHFPIIAPPPCFVIPPLKIRNVHNNCADVMWDNPVSSLYRRIEFGPAGFTPGTGIIIDNFYGDSIHFQNLAPDFDYEVHVSSFCSTDSVYTEPTVAFFSTAMNCDM